ncbi:clathrin heavy chain linker domain-containing protein 1-like [Antennarius striatus]|uniref:clathrin heavy chain linker domain-containing protein 1-like n=1 Tax=Antennarius striatus TaxID=241820 RepID=UPI0035B083D5
MSDPQSRSRHPADELSVCGCDESFFRSLTEFTEREKRFGPGSEGPDRVRHSIYRSVFSQVISRATSYQRLLLAIKAGYDDIIRELQRRAEEAESVRRTLAASTSRGVSMATCQRRAAQLRRRTSDLQRETDELQEELRGRVEARREICRVPGLTGVQSEDPEVLDRHLRHLDARRAALLDRRSRCVSLEVKTRLDDELQTAERRRDRLSLQNRCLTVQWAESKNVRLVWAESKNVCLCGRSLQMSVCVGGAYLCRSHRLVLVSERLSSLSDDRRTLEDLLMSIQRLELTDGDAFTPDVDEHPTGVDQSKQLSDHLDRFSDLLEAGRYGEAAQVAAGCPGGVLRNLDVMEMFESVWGGSAPPLLLFFHALLASGPPQDKLPAVLSHRVVLHALRLGATRLVAHAVATDRLTPSEDLGDALTDHALQNRGGVADACLAWAAAVYGACGADRKVALSMCRRGLIHNAAAFIKGAAGLTADDCLWVLARSSCAPLLLQLLAAPPSAILSVGGACCALLAGPQQQDLVLEVLDSFVSRGPGVLEEAILEDSHSSLDDWTQLASLCAELNRSDLSRAIMAVLLDQNGTRVLTPDPEGARLVEHIYL